MSVSIFRRYTAMSADNFGNDVTITIRVYTFIVFITFIEFFNAFKMCKINKKRYLFLQETMSRLQGLLTTIGKK